METRLAQHLAPLHSSFFVLAAARRHVAGLALVQQLAEHLDAGDRRPLGVAQATISTSRPLDHTLLHLPVTTVPRPVIDITSSIGMRNGLSTSRSGSGMYESTASISSDDLLAHWVASSALRA